MFYSLVCKSILLITLAASLSFAEGCVSENDSSETDPIFANFCFYKDTSVFVGKDSGFVLTAYEMIDDISFTIDARNRVTKTYFDVSLVGVSSDKAKINPFRGMSGGACLGARCRHSLAVSPYDLIDFYFSAADSLYVKSLAGLVHPLKWKYELDFGRQKQSVSGENYIYVSGFCNQMQLEKIRKRGMQPSLNK